MSNAASYPSALREGSSLASPSQSGQVRKGRVHTLRANLKRSVLDGGYYGWMVGIGESYIPAFALAIGLGEVASGLIVGIPMVVGGMVQLISPKAIQYCGSYRRWIVLASACQAIAFLPLIVAATMGTMEPWILFLIVSCYWASGMAAGPAWNAWISNVVPNSIRPRYFARRTRLIQLATFCGFLFGGFVLYVAYRSEAVLLGFATLFLMAALARAISALYLAQHQVVDPHPIAGSQKVAVDEPLSVIGRRLVVYLVCMQVFVQCSGPYFVPYMLKKLQFSYEEFVFLTGVALVSKGLSMPLWGSIASRRGGRFLLGVGGVSIIPLASMWTLSDSVTWLAIVQATSGATWAAYELGFFLIFLNHVPQAQRAKLMTTYNFANSWAWFVGSIIGGWILSQSQASYGAYHLVFWFSSLGRLACLFLLWRVQTTPHGKDTQRIVKASADSQAIHPGRPADSPMLGTPGSPTAPVLDQAA